MSKTYVKCKYVVEKVWNEFDLYGEIRYEGENEDQVEEIILRSRNEIVVLPDLSKNDYSSAFLMKADNGLWELYIPIYETNRRSMDLKNFHKVATNIECYELIDSYILYKVVPENENAYWQCFSLNRCQTLTPIWNSRDYLHVIPERIKNLPKIFKEEVSFDLKVREMNEDLYFRNLCVLKADGETIIVKNEDTHLGGKKMSLTYEYLPGEIKYYYDGFAVVQCESDNILHQICWGSRSEKFPNIVKIDQVLKKGLKDCENPTNGIAILNEEGKVLEIMCKFQGLRNDEEWIISEKRISMKFDIPVDKFSFRRISTSKPKKFVFEINKWNNNQKTSIYDFDGVIFEM